VNDEYNLNIMQIMMLTVILMAMIILSTLVGCYRVKIEMYVSREQNHFTFSRYRIVVICNHTIMSL